jgi:hypothetical protein
MGHLGTLGRSRRRGRRIHPPRIAVLVRTRSLSSMSLLTLN